MKVLIMCRYKLLKLIESSNKERKWMLFCLKTTVTYIVRSEWDIAHLSLRTYKFRYDLLRAIDTRQLFKIYSNRSSANSTAMSTLWSKESTCKSANCQFLVSFTPCWLKDGMLVLCDWKVSHCSGSPMWLSWIA